MTIDERLDRLTGRHEVLTQTVEMILAMQREGEDRRKEMEKNMAKLETHMVTLTDTMDRLANIVIRHEERLDKLDGGS